MAGRVLDQPLLRSACRTEHQVRFAGQALPVIFSKRSVPVSARRFFQQTRLAVFDGRIRRRQVEHVHVTGLDEIEIAVVVEVA